VSDLVAMEEEEEKERIIVSFRIFIMF